MSMHSMTMLYMKPRDYLLLAGRAFRGCSPIHGLRWHATINLKLLELCCVMESVTAKHGQFCKNSLQQSIVGSHPKRSFSMPQELWHWNRWNGPAVGLVNSTVSSKFHIYILFWYTNLVNRLQLFCVPSLQSDALFPTFPIFPNDPQLHVEV